MLVQGKVPLAQSLIKYAQEGSYPVVLDRDVVKQLGRRIVLTNVIEVDEKTGYVRHNSERLAQVLLRWYSHA
ncbi:hypothetical protein WN50_31870 [Limnoraphis robusta CS-951]|uniref:Uncharacterized protein n=1 Tax=Limnoraphis robusta CS-951 TaxID=1637645 RepID=A0A0J9EXQ3_9CYAN|nr:hypothetical protein WN50_31870 [Limnoraphis robusta CS-951]